MNIEKEQTKLFEEMGVFFAFSNKQFDEQKKEGINYVNMGAGTICPKENVRLFIERHAEIVKNGIAKDIKENGFRNIIERELANYECYWTGDIESAVDALEDYDFPHNLIWEVYIDTKHKYGEP